MAQAYKFNPGFQSDTEAVANFVVRQRELGTVLEALQSDRGAPRQLVVAPRGAGKTTLCRRVLAEIRTEDALRARWQPIFLGEESYTVTTPGEFFLECLFHLADQLSDPDLRAMHDEAAGLSAEADLRDACLGALRTYAEGEAKRLLVIVENFHILLNDQISSGGEELINLLADEQLFGVLATSVSQTSIENDNPLLEGFDKLPLSPLSLDECHALWTALTEQDVPKNRIRPLQILTGGSPRLIHILAEFMKTPSLRDLMDNLNLLIDQNTEYFKSQLDALPAVERKVFATLLDAWDPSTAKQIAEAARVNINTASAMLGRLSDRGAVLREPGRGRSVLYFAAERLFNIYYLMRRRSHPSSRVRALVAFMTEYYDRDELVDTTAKLVREACLVDPASRSDYHWAFDAILTVQPEAVRSRILAQTPADFLRSFRADTTLPGERFPEVADLPSPDAPSAGTPFERLMDAAQLAADESRWADARALLDEAEALQPHNPGPSMRRAMVSVLEGDLDQATDHAARAVELDSTVAVTHVLLGVVLAMAGDREEAETSFQTALELEPDFTLGLSELAKLREEANDTAGALDLYRRAAGAGTLPDNYAARFGRLLMREHAMQEAEDVLRAVVEDAEPRLDARRALVDLLHDTDRTDEAIGLLREAAASGDEWVLWADLGSFLLSADEEPAEALVALETAVDKGAESPVIYRMLAHAMRLNGQDADAAAHVGERLIQRFGEHAWAWSSAGDIFFDNELTDRAEQAFRRAAAMDDSDYARIKLAEFLVDQARDAPDVDTVLDTAIEAAHRLGVCGPMKDLAEVLVHRGNDEQAIGLLEGALDKNDRCSCSLVMRGDIAARRGDGDTARRCYDAALALNDEDVGALTGLARISGADEAEALVTRAIDADPADPRCLLARATLSSRKLSSRIDDVSEALDRNPELTEARLILAPLEARRGDPEAALTHLSMALPDLDSHRELIPAFVNVALDLARQGLDKDVSAILAGDAGRTVEPLSVALKLARGENPAVAKEILEVATDIAGRLEHAKLPSTLAVPGGS